MKAATIYNLEICQMPQGGLGAYLVPEFTKLEFEPERDYPYPSDNSCLVKKLDRDILMLQDGTIVPSVMDIAERISTLAYKNHKAEEWNSAIENNEWVEKVHTRWEQQCDKADNPGAVANESTVWTHPTFGTQGSKPTPWEIINTAVEEKRLKAHNAEARKIQGRWIAENS